MTKNELEQLAQEVAVGIKRGSVHLDLLELKVAFFRGVQAIRDNTGRDDIGDLLAVEDRLSFAIARFDGGVVVLRKLDAELVKEIPTDELDDWRMYYERLGLESLDHAALLDAELKRRSPPLDARGLVDALKDPKQGW